MVSFLEMCIRYGVSLVVAGRTSSGKTTLLNALLSSIPDEKRIYSIESGARELFLVRRNRIGEVKNNVVHTLSRPSENLVVAALRFDPDIVVVGEIRDAEANSAVEASLTGHTVVTTVHSGPAEAAHGRISLLCQRRFQLGMEVSLAQSRQAFLLLFSLINARTIQERSWTSRNARSPPKEKPNTDAYTVTTSQKTSVRTADTSSKGISLRLTSPPTIYACYSHEAVYRKQCSTIS